MCHAIDANSNWKCTDGSERIFRNYSRSLQWTFWSTASTLGRGRGATSFVLRRWPSLLKNRTNMRMWCRRRTWNCCAARLLFAALSGTIGAQPTSTASLTLAQAVQNALRTYPSVTVSAEQLNAAAARIQLARTAYLPRVDALAHVNRATRNNIFGMLLPQSEVGHRFLQKHLAHCTQADIGATDARGTVLKRVPLPVLRRVPPAPLLCGVSVVDVGNRYAVPAIRR
jgi:hypothetical protein